MVTVEEFKRELSQDPRRIGRQIRFVVGLTVGLTFLIFGIQISRPRVYVLAGPAKAVGRVTGYVKRTGYVWNAKHTSQTSVTGYHPTVEFQVDGQIIRFEDWRGFDTVPPVNSSLPVIYDRHDPSKAMIDESLWNFIPWVPITIVGFLLFVNALRYWPTNQPKLMDSPR